MADDTQTKPAKASCAVAVAKFWPHMITMPCCLEENLGMKELQNSIRVSKPVEMKNFHSMSVDNVYEK